MKIVRNLYKRLSIPSEQQGFPSFCCWYKNGGFFLSFIFFALAPRKPASPGHHESCPLGKNSLSRAQKHCVPERNLPSHSGCPTSSLHSCCLAPCIYLPN